MVAGVREADSEVSSSCEGTGEGGKLSGVVVMLSSCCTVVMLAVVVGKEDGREKIYEAPISNGCLVNFLQCVDTV